MKTIIKRFLRFKKEVFRHKRRLFRDLASGQKPMALFITCADSRIVPDLITQSQPGDLFICRIVGSQIPPHGSAAEGRVASAVEYSGQARALVLDHYRDAPLDHNDATATPPSRLKTVYLTQEIA